MKKFIQTIKNIFKIEELRKRIVYTILLLLVISRTTPRKALWGS